MPKAKRKSGKSVRTSVPEVTSVQSILRTAKGYVNRTSKGKKAAIVAGGAAVIALITTKMGRRLLKSIGGLAMPFVAGMAQRKVVEQVAQKI